MRQILLQVMLLQTLRLAAAQIDPAFPGTDTRVSRNAICACRGTLYIGGDFTKVGGQPRSGVAAIEIATGKLLDWAPRLVSPTVAAIACKDGVIYLGGSFILADGHKQSYLAAYNAADAGAAHLSADWRPVLGEPVADILPSADGTLYVGGRFEGGLVQVSDAKHGRGEATAFNSDFDDRVTTLAFDPQDASALIAAGRFKKAGGQARDLVARLNRKSGALLPQQIQVAGGPSKEILRMINHSGVLYLVGVEIASVNGQPRSNAFALNPQDFSLKPWRADLDAGAGALSAWGERVIIGGDFRHVNGESRRLAAVDAESGGLLAWNPAPDHNTYAVLALHGVTYLSGYWSHLNGQYAEHFAALNDE